MYKFFFIFCFGGLGCLSRYSLSSFISKVFGDGFPWGTLVVNVLGAFIIGFFMEITAQNELISSDLRSGLTTGFLGGLTTFSTFSLETFLLFDSGRYGAGIANASLNVVICVVFAGIGVFLARSLKRG
ncbi:MAG: camphor resistance protein CrcB [Treponema sp. CETP13]|nr:MAG: camphor resistance protein CrcB [Treponema sp. CETP13]